jgi:hypothetical protein
MLPDPLRILAPIVSVTNNDIVFLGCSFTEGTGLIDIKTRYSSLLAAYYNKNEINLAIGGGSNYRSFDLFGQLNFVNSGSTLVLQLTQLSRLRWYDSKIVDRSLSVQPSKELIYTYNDQFLIYDLIRQLRIIVKYCREKQIKLIMWSIASFADENMWQNLESYLQQFPEYVYLNDRLNEPDTYRVDDAPDRYKHPGPESNKLITKKLITHFDNLYDSLCKRR